MGTVNITVSERAFCVVYRATGNKKKKKTMRVREKETKAKTEKVEVRVTKGLQS